MVLAQRRKGRKRRRRADFCCCCVEKWPSGGGGSSRYLLYVFFCSGSTRYVVWKWRLTEIINGGVQLDLGCVQLKSNGTFSVVLHSL